MVFSEMTEKQMYEMMRKRHAYFSEIVKEYTSFEDLIRENEEWFAIKGIELFKEEKYVSLHMQLNPMDYETYHVIHGKDGKLAISHVIWWSDIYDANTIFNIFTEDYANEEDILTQY